MRAKFVKEITVYHPDYKCEVSMSVFKHDNGRMFALDSSYIEENFDFENDVFISDPFEAEYCELELLI